MVVAKQSHNNITNDVEDVGTILFGSASFNFGYKIFISLALNNMLFESEAIPIIFRTAKLKDFETPENVPEEVKKFLKMWNSFGGKYVKYDQVSRHEMLKLDAYVHITSPIRRLVDLLNIIELQDVLDLCSLTMGASKFYKRWTNKEKFEYINITMRSIRKVQNDCALLNICVTDKSVIDKEHDGFIFDKIKRNDDLYQYMVYFPEMKMVNRFTSRYDKVNLSKQKFKLFIFIDEIRLREKIRIEVID